MRVRNVTASASFELATLRPLIRPGVSTEVATFAVTITPSSLHRNTIAPVFQNYTNITYQREVWAGVPRQLTPLDVDVNLHLNTGAVVGLSFQLQLSRLEFSDAVTSVGHVLPDSVIFRSVAVQNTHDLPVAFHGATFDAVAPARGLASISIPIKIGGPGRFNITHLITTNLTAPFAIYVAGKASPPRAVMCDADGTTVSILRFGGTVWRATIYLHNIGKVNVTCPLGFADSVFRMRAECTAPLPPRTQCPLHFTANPRAVHHRRITRTWAIDGIAGTTLTIIAEAGPDDVARMGPGRRVAVYVLCGAVAAPLCDAVWRRARITCDSRRRKAALRFVVERLSVGAMQSRHTQTSFHPPAFTGTWSPTTETMPTVCESALAAMTALITD
jgi:hypothetical protein